MPATRALATPATTRAAYVPLMGLAKQSASTFVSDLRNRGYNTLIVPALENGMFHIKRRGRRSRSRLVGPLADALAAGISQRRTSVWLSIDPLAAGPRGSGHLGRLADGHREWLLRNTRGRVLPVGNEDHDPLFSWMNVLYRRFLGDHLVAMAEAYPVSGIVVDLRRYPGMSTDHNRWYCCSFQSQFRAEEALGIGFEHLLFDGTQADVRIWQDWVLSELQAFIENLAARVRTTRNDVSWKLLIPAVVAADPSAAPWLATAAEGVADELLVEINDPATDLTAMIAAIDEITGRHLTIIPAWPDEKAMAEGAPAFKQAPSPGYAVMMPGIDPEQAMPDLDLRWDAGGAMEDDPLLSARVVALAMGEGLEPESEYGRRYLTMAEQLERLEPEYNQLSLMQEQAITLLSALQLDARDFAAQHPALLRDADLLVRLLSMVRLQPVLV